MTYPLVNILRLPSALLRTFMACVRTYQVNDTCPEKRAIVVLGI